MDIVKVILKKIKRLEFETCCLRNEIDGGSGDGLRFGIEDNIAAEDRSFNMSDGNNFTFIGGTFSLGTTSPNIFNVYSPIVNQDMLAIDDIAFQTLFQATDGTAFTSFIANADLTGNNVQFALSTTDNINLVQIAGDALLQTINLAAGNGIMINSAYTLPLTDGTNGQVMTTDGAGIVSWGVGGGGGGSQDLQQVTIIGSSTNVGIIVDATLNGASYLAETNDIQETSVLLRDNVSNRSIDIVVPAGGADSPQININNIAGGSVTVLSDNTPNGNISTLQWPDGSGTLGLSVNSIPFDTTGNVLISGLPSVVSASNGLSIDGGSGDVILGGDLNQTTNIDNHAFILDFTGSGVATLHTHNTNGGIALAGSDTTSGIGVYGETATGKAIQANASGSGVGMYTASSTGVGLFVTSASGVGAQISSTSGTAASLFVTPSSTNTIIPITDFRRLTSGTPANNIGGSIDILLPTSSSSNAYANKLISRVTDINNASFTTEFSIQGVNSAALQTLLTLSGSGAAKLNQYGLGNFTGTPAFTLKVDSSGNIIEDNSGGGSDLYTTDGIVTDAERIVDLYTNATNLHFLVGTSPFPEGLEISAGDKAMYWNSDNGSELEIGNDNGGFGVTITSNDGLTRENKLVSVDSTSSDTVRLDLISNQADGHKFSLGINSVVSITGDLNGFSSGISVTDGTATGAIVAAADLVGNNVSVFLSSFNGTNFVDIILDSTNNIINYEAGKHNFTGRINHGGATPQFANNAVAILGGLSVGDEYYTNVAGDGILKIVI